MTQPNHAASRPRGLSWLPYVVLGLVAVVCLAVATTRDPGASTPEDRINAVAETIKCPTCQGESVADSSAPTSREIRADIAERLARGESPDEIRAFYADSYGDAILLTPSASGVTSIVWVLPVVALAGATAGLVIVFRRWRRTDAVHASDDDAVLVERARAERRSVDPS
jgi:cytochrome c-type biogenesis protein CcmH/NrfF